MNSSRHHGITGSGDLFRSVFLAGLLMCVGQAAIAHSLDVYVKETSTGSGESSNLTLPVGTANYFIGFQNILVALDSSGTGATSFAALCVDVSHYASTSYQANYDPSSNSVASVFPTQVSDIENLYNLYYAGTIGNNAKAAAFQLALWEISQDDENLHTGVVQVTGSTDSTLVTNAANLLSNLSYSGPNLYNLTMYQVDRSIAGSSGQSYIVAQPVPEPEACAMLLAGLGLVGFAARGRKRS
ncbi:MAG TPA: PEP-CTERM sorting domain-containing protein [Burkholderiales bacterium]|nr:PEP-CTERM sorting domain-containing protein [Burkholderiales bacterium]